MSEKIIDIGVSADAPALQAMDRGYAAHHRLLRDDRKAVAPHLRRKQGHQLALCAKRDLFTQWTRRHSGFDLAFDARCVRIELQPIGRTRVQRAGMSVEVQKIDDVFGGGVVELMPARIAPLLEYRVGPAAPHPQPPSRNGCGLPSDRLLNLNNRARAAEINHLLHESASPVVNVRIDEAGECVSAFQVDRRAVSAMDS